MSYLQIRRSTVYAYILQKTKIQSTWIITNYVGLKRQERLTLAFSIAILLLSIDALLWVVSIYNPLYFWLRSHVYSRYGHLFDKWLIG